MAILKIPFYDSASFVTVADLNGQNYNLEFLYNETSDYWTMNIYDNSEDKNLLLGGLLLSEGITINQGFVFNGLPPGRFISLRLDNAKRAIENEYDAYVNGTKTLFYIEA